MKVWYGFGSEHSMNLVMIGKFKTEQDAQKAKLIVDKLNEAVREELEADNMDGHYQTDEYTDKLKSLLRELEVYTISPYELDQLAYDFRIEATNNQITIKTDESEFSVFLKLFIDQGAKIEVYSTSDYPDDNE